MMCDEVGNFVTSQDSGYFARPVWFCADLAGLRQSWAIRLLFDELGKGRLVVFPVGPPKLCTRCFYDYLLSKRVRTAKGFDFKQWQLLYIGDSFSCSWEVRKFVRSFWKGWARLL